MDTSLEEIVKKSIKNYDNNYNKYYKYINMQNVNVDVNSQQITFENKDNFKYEVAGIFDSTTKIWMWSWMIPEFKYKDTLLVKKLLNYGLKIDPYSTVKDAKDSNRRILDNMLYLKTQLVNSRFLLSDNIQLELHLAIATYLVKDNIKFIYPRIKYIDKSKNKFITVYYFILNE